MNRRGLLFAWCITIAAFFTYGFLYHSGETPPEKLIREKVSQPETDTSPVESSDIVGGEIETESSPSYTPLDYREILDAGTGNPYSDPKLYAFLERVSPRYFSEIIEQTLNRPWVDSHNGGEVLSKIYARWAHLDLDAAMQSAYQIEHPSMRDSALAAVVGVYAKKDPKGAFDYYKNYLHGEAHLNNRMGGSVIRNLSVVDPQQAVVEAAAFIEAGERPGWMSNELARGLMEEMTAGEAFRIISGVDNSAFHEAMISAILSNDIWTNERPLKTLATLQNLPEGELREQAITAFPLKWASKDPEAATGWLMTQDDEELKTSHIGQVVSAWIRKEPSAASEWLNERTISPELDPAVESLVQQVMKNGDDPATAFTWAISYSDASERRRGDSQWTLREWLKRGAETAEVHQVVDESKLPDSEKKMLHSVIRKYQIK